MGRKEQHHVEAHHFYHSVLSLLLEAGFSFLLGGGFAMKVHTKIVRDSKDLDIFCRPRDFEPMLWHLQKHGYKVEISDSRWLGKAFCGDHFIDIIFNSVNNICPVDDTWFQNAYKGNFDGIPVQYVGAEELFWCKIYVQNRDRYDGADLNHIILTKGKEMKWDLVLKRLEHHWHLLLAQFLNFQFVYPSERDVIPRWLFDKLLERASKQYDLPVPIGKICRGPLVEQIHYTNDITQWNYKVITIKTI
jgi:hypothetical protein